MHTHRRRAAALMLASCLSAALVVGSGCSQTRPEGGRRAKVYTTPPNATVYVVPAAKLPNPPNPADNPSGFRAFQAERGRGDVLVGMGPTYFFAYDEPTQRWSRTELDVAPTIQVLEVTIPPVN